MLEDILDIQFSFFFFLNCISSDFSDLPDKLKQVNTLVYLYLNYRKFI